VRARYRGGVGFPRRPLGRGSGSGLADVEQCCPGDRFWKGGQVAKHDLDDVADRVGRAFGPTRPFKPSIDEQLKQIEGQDPDQQDSQ